MARGTGTDCKAQATSSLARPRGQRSATPALADTLRALNTDCGGLLRLTAEARTEVVTTSGLRDRSPIAALIADALSEGALSEGMPARALHEVLQGRRNESYIVEALLMFTPAERENIGKAQRERVFASDHGRCCRADKTCSGPDTLNADHFLPVRLGGRNGDAENPDGNLWTLCRTHNVSGKRESFPTEAEANAWLTTGRLLPAAYLNKLAERPWREGFVADPNARPARSMTKERRGPVKKIRVAWTGPTPFVPSASPVYR